VAFFENVEFKKIASNKFLITLFSRPSWHWGRLSCQKIYQEDTNNATSHRQIVNLKLWEVNNMVVPYILIYPNTKASVRMLLQMLARQKFFVTYRTFECLISEQSSSARKDEQSADSRGERLS